MLNLCQIWKTSHHKTNVISSDSHKALAICFQDIFQLGQKQFLITIDHYNDFYELDELSNTLSAAVVNHTKAYFASHGIPAHCLTDNGPQFISNEYKLFVNKFGFEHVTTSPYWSRSNGKAEAAVSDGKAIIKKSDDIYLALLNIHTRTTIPIPEDLLMPKSLDSSVIHSVINRCRAAAKL